MKVLRTFRDTVLLAYVPGRAFVEWYYRISPPVAEIIARHSTISAAVRLLLLPVIGLAWLCLKIGTLATLLFMVMFGVALVTVPVLSRSRRRA